MEQRIKERYNETVLKEARERYGIAADGIRALDGFESFIYEFERDSGAYILRIGHSLRRSEGLIRGEVDWMNYLAAGGATVAEPVLSENGRPVEAIEDGQGGHFLATAFVKAEGRPPWEVGWTPELYEKYGQLIGRMHALTKAYEVPDRAWRRPEWDSADLLEVEKFLPATEGVAAERFQALMRYLQQLPKDGDSYGLIHQDAHAGNMLVDDAGTITLFDFDDCTYSWFMNDIAIVLFYAVMGAEDEAKFTQSFLGHFWRGYRRENRLEAAWLREIPHFLKLREIDLYAVIHRSFDVDNLSDPWVAGYMNGRKERIERDRPVVDFDFTVLAETIDS